MKTEQSSASTGRVFDIQRFSIHDGPGIRTTVFLKGCPLRCLWCHNPEGMRWEHNLAFDPGKCIACGECVRVCPNQAHTLDVSGSSIVHSLDRERCQVCGACAGVCDPGGLELLGRDMTVREVMEQVLCDRPFYAASGGGLTISGGEPMAQIDFTVSLLQAARNAGIHCALETCGYTAWEQLLRILPLVDLFLYDYKETDPELHKQFTGRSNEIILRNLRALYDAGATIQLQCPIVPGFNDTDAHRAGIEAIRQELPRLAGVTMLPYHPLGKSKLERLDECITIKGF